MAPPFVIGSPQRSFVRVFGKETLLGTTSSGSQSTSAVICDLSRVANINPVDQIPSFLRRESIESQTNMNRNRQLNINETQQTQTNNNITRGHGNLNHQATSNNHSVQPRPSMMQQHPSPCMVQQHPTPCMVQQHPRPSMVQQHPTPSIVQQQPTPSMVQQHPRPQTEVDTPITTSSINVDREALYLQLQNESNALIQENEVLQTKLRMFQNLFRDKDRTNLYELLHRLDNYGTQHQIISGS